MGYVGIKNNKVWENLGDSGDKGTAFKNVIDSPLYQEDEKEILWQRKYGYSLRIWNHTEKMK